jgi:hypothetical protein
MNFPRLYQQSVGKGAKPEPEPENSAQIILNDERAQWLSNPYTVKLLSKLEAKYFELLEECVGHYQAHEIIRDKLNKAKQIKEILTYVNGSSNT